MLRSATLGLATLALCATATAQLPLSLNFSFVDVAAGGNGNIGVTQDDVTLNYHVIDFSNATTVHVFDLLGNPLPALDYTTTGCTPAQSSPNDITYDSITQTVWTVDNSGNSVVNLDLAGNCLGGWNFTPGGSNPVGITHNLVTNTLFISYSGGVQEYDTTGNLLSTFSFTPPGGSAILSGITYVVTTNTFLVTQSGGSSIFEIDNTGALLGTTDLSSFGIGNTQGLHFNVLLNQLMVVDNSLSTTFVFDLSTCSGSSSSFGTGCVDGGGTTLTLGVAGCPGVGSTFDVIANGSNDGLPMVFLVGLSNTTGPGGLPLPVNLGLVGTGAGCSLYVSGEFSATVPTVGGTATLSLSIPAGSGLAGTTFYWQALKADLSLPDPLPIAASNGASSTIN